MRRRSKLPLHGSGEAHVILRQSRLLRRKFGGVAGAAGAQQRGFLVQHLDQPVECGKRQFAEIGGGQGVDGGNALGGVHL